MVISVCCVATFFMSLWILADILQHLHEIHDCLQDLTKTLYNHKHLNTAHQPPHEQDIRLI